MEWAEWTEWTDEEVARAYRESTPALRAALDYLAERPGREVSSVELARVVYPHDSDVGAERRLYGVLTAFGRRSYGYGKKEWFFQCLSEAPPGRIARAGLLRLRYAGRKGRVAA